MRSKNLNAIMQVEELSNGVSIRVGRFSARREPTIPTPDASPNRTKERDSALVYARNRLLAWSKWAKEHRRDLGYPTISALYRAIQSQKIGIKRGTAYPTADEHGVVDYPINADGRETRSFRPITSADIPEAFLEVERAVAKVPRRLNEVGTAYYFTYGSLEERVKETNYKRAQFLHLLECFDYAVYIGLQ